jgi:hypothetical protein
MLRPEVSKKLRYFETSVAAYPVTQRLIPEEAFLNDMGIRIFRTRKYHVLGRANA